MGQQQLLLVILVTIIVGIATVVAINTFGSAASNANVSAVRNDVATIASDAQGQYRKPASLGGAGQAWTNIKFTGMAFPAKKISSDEKSAVNQNGTYTISGTTDHLVITAYPSSDEAYDGNVTGPKIATAGATMVYNVTQNDLTLVTDYTATSN